MNAIDYINEKYDISIEHSAKIDFDFELDESKLVTVIAGGSGTGKTTLLRKWFNVDDVNFKNDSDKSIFEELMHNDDFEETSKLLFDVGLASVPVWKNNYARLSNGEKLRFEIAYKLKNSDDIFFVDEFTSMLDRQTAKNMSLKLNELLTKYNKRVVLATAHFDVLDWIKVDQLVDTNLKKLQSLQHPTLITLMMWRLDEYQKSCGEHLVNITI